MHQMEPVVSNPVMPPPEAIETEEFKLEMLDCGPAYKAQDAGALCFSCVCGSGCLCGSAATQD
jgi:hypothetical protein